MDEPNCKKSTCRLCGYVFDCATGVTGTDVPKAGCISLCAKCGAIGIFEADTTVRLATDDEVRDIMASNVGPLIAKAQRLIRAESGSKSLIHT